MENLAALTDTELIVATLEAQLRKDWEDYAELKKEFFSRLTPDKLWLPEEAERAAHWAGLATF